MKFHEAGITIWCGDDTNDLAYLRAISEIVYDSYCGHAKGWKPCPSAPLWKISFGDRAGVFGAKLNGRVSCVKLFYDKRIRAKLRTMMGLSKGRWAYRNGVRLNRMGIACPGMWGCIERRPFGPTMIVTELIEDGTRLDHWVIQNGTPRGAVLNLAQFTRHMHDNGVIHTDLSPRNILIRPHEQHFEFLLLDYEDARFRPRISRRHRLDNLHHLHERMFHYVPLRERLRFLRAYAGQDYRPFRNMLGRMINKSQPRKRSPSAPPQTREPNRLGQAN